MSCASRAVGPGRAEHRPRPHRRRQGVPVDRSRTSSATRCKRNVPHVDFIQVNLNEEITIAVPIVPRGRGQGRARRTTVSSTPRVDTIAGAHHAAQHPRPSRHRHHRHDDGHRHPLDDIKLPAGVDRHRRARHGRSSPCSIIRGARTEEAAAEGEEGAEGEGAAAEGGDEAGDAEAAGVDRLIDRRLAPACTEPIVNDDA